MDIDQVVPDPQQPRAEFDQESIERLAASLQQQGQLAPIRVRWCDDIAKWVIIAGERRWRTSRQAGRSTIECYFHEAELSRSEVVLNRTNVCFLLTTNQHRHIDRAITDRADLEILVELPGRAERTRIIQDVLAVVESWRIFPLALKGPGRRPATELGRLVKVTDGFSGRDLRHLVLEALAIRTTHEPLNWTHLIQAAETKRALNRHDSETRGVYLHEYE